MATFSRRGTALAVLILALVAQPLWADDDDSLRQQALKLNEITGTDPMEGELRLLLKDEAGSKKLIAVAFEMAKEKNQPFNYTGAFLLARAAHSVKEYDAAQLFYKIAKESADKVQSSSKIIQVYDGLIDLSIDDKKYDDAIKTCREFLEIDNPDRTNPINQVKPFVMEKMIQVLAKQGKLDEALKLTDDLIDADTDGWYFVKLKAEVYREVNKFEDAAKAYEETLERLKKLKDVDEDRRSRFMRVVRYALSGVYVDMNRVDKAADQLQLLLKKDPDNPTFCNDLGFIWADHDMKLDESEKLIRKAIEEDRKKRKKEGLSPDEDKDNPAYLDSLGWVLFKLKKYDEAKKYLEEATDSKEGQHIEILDHLADVYIALGKKREAVKVWQKALKKDEDDMSSRDKKRRSNIEKKLKKYQDN